MKKLALKLTSIISPCLAMGFCLSLVLIFWPQKNALALPLGTLLYRTSDEGQMYGYNNKNLIVSEKGLIKHIYSGHVAIYVGTEDGVDYVVEALGEGVVKNPARYFVNSALGEQFLGAKIPRLASSAQAERAALIAKRLAEENLAYDFDFKKQKGPASGDWTCVGLTEKIYESVDLAYPENSQVLQYDPAYYGLNITPDGYDKSSLYNSAGDCFSQRREFSKITRQNDMIIPLPELIGYAAGLEYENDRYIFLPYTQFIQASLKDVSLDIEVASSFPDEEIRGNLPVWSIVLKWSLINNPISTLKKIARVVWPGQSALIENSLNGNISSGNSNPSAASTPESNGLAGLSPTPNNLEAAEIVKDILEIIPSEKKSASSSSSSSVRENLVVKTGAKNSVVTPSSDAKAATATAAALKKTAASASTKTSGQKSSTASTSTSKATVAKPKIVAPVKNSFQPQAPVVGASPQTKVVVAEAATATPQTYVKPANHYSGGDNSGTSTSTTGTSNSSSTISGDIYSTSSNTYSISEIDPNLILAPGHLVISRIGEAGEDDWVELFNPYPVEFDLALNNYRLERAKTAADPSIMIRFGNIEDGTYKTTVIPPYGRYLITSSKASAELKDKSQAISERDEFSWLKSGYTLYLGNDALSSPLDPNLKDFIGFGEATYYEGGGPALALNDNFYLSRKALATSTPVLLLPGGAHNSLDLVYDSNNNQFDWLLLPNSGRLDEPSNDNASSTDSSVESGLESANLTYLDHFDECYQSGESFVVGRWGCARILYFNYQSEKVNLNPNLSSGNFSLRLSYKSLGLYPRFYLKLSNENSNENLEISLENAYSQISGLPNIEWRNYDHAWYPDSEWHDLTLVVNQTEAYWAIYNDAKQVYKKNYEGDVPIYKFLEFGGTNDYVAVDELALWNRALGLEELKLIKAANLPFRPLANQAPWVPAALRNFYGFDENSGSIIHDSISSNNLEIGANLWYSNGRVGGYIFQDQQQPLISGGLDDITGSDLSLTLWWRNRSHPNEGRLLLHLNHDETVKFGLIVGNYRPAYIFDGVYTVIEEGTDKIIPFDDNWHHLALTYSAHDYKLNFYVDGELKMSRPYIYLRPGEAINKIELRDDNYSYDLDELGVWQGTLSAAEVKNIYESD